MDLMNVLDSNLWKEIKRVKSMGFETLLRKEQKTREDYWDIIDKNYDLILEEIAEKAYEHNTLECLVDDIKGNPLAQKFRLSATFYHNNESVASSKIPDKIRAYEILRVMEKAKEYKYYDSKAFKRKIDTNENGVSDFIEKYIFDFQKMWSELGELVEPECWHYLDSDLSDAIDNFDNMLLEYIKSEHAYTIFGDLKEIYTRYSIAEEKRISIDERVKSAVKEKEIEMLRVQMKELRDEKIKALQGLDKERERSDKITDSFQERETRISEQWQKTLDTLTGLKEEYANAQRALEKDIGAFDENERKVLQNEAERLQESMLQAEKKTNILNNELQQMKVDNAVLTAEARYLNMSLEDSKKEMIEISKKLEEEQNIKSSLEEDLKTNTEKVRKLSDELEKAEETRYIDKTSLDELKDKLDSANKDLSKTKHQINEKDNALLEKKHQLSTLKQGIEKGTTLTSGMALNIEESILSRFRHNILVDAEINFPLNKKKYYNTKSGKLSETSNIEKMCREFKITSQQARRYPNNKRVTLRISEYFKPKINIETKVYCHTRNYWKTKIDNRKVTYEEIYDIVTEANEKAKGNHYFCALCIASPTGFITAVEKEFYNKIYHNLFLVLYDAQSQNYIYNKNDPNSEIFKDFFNFRDDTEEKYNALAEKIKNLLYLTCEGMVSEGYCHYELNGAEYGDIRKSFELLERRGVGEILEKIDIVDGWVLQRIGRI